MSRQERRTRLSLGTTALTNKERAYLIVPVSIITPASRSKRSRSSAQTTARSAQSSSPCTSPRCYRPASSNQRNSKPKGRSLLTFTHHSHLRKCRSTLLSNLQRRRKGPARRLPHSRTLERRAQVPRAHNSRPPTKRIIRKVAIRAPTTTSPSEARTICHISSRAGAASNQTMPATRR